VQLQDHSVHLEVLQEDPRGTLQLPLFHIDQGIQLPLVGEALQEAHLRPDQEVLSRQAEAAHREVGQELPLPGPPHHQGDLVAADKHNLTQSLLHLKELYQYQ
jgi:hypothetical protein